MSITRISIRNFRSIVSFADNVKDLTIFVGENDEPAFAQKTSEAVPNATFVCFPGLDHVDASCRTDLVLPLMRKFLAEAGEG